MATRKSTAKLEVVAPDAIRSPSDFTDGERIEFQALCDIVDAGRGLTTPDLVLIEAVIRDRRSEVQGRRLADLALESNDLKGWKDATGMAIRAAGNVRANLMALNLTTAARSSKQTKTVQGKRVAESDPEWSSVLTKK